MTFNFLDHQESPAQIEHVVSGHLDALKSAMSEYNLSESLPNKPVTKQSLNKPFTLEPAPPTAPQEAGQKSADWVPEIIFTARFEGGVDGDVALLSQGFALSEGKAPFLTEKGNRLHAFVYEIRDEITSEGDACSRLEYFRIEGNPPLNPKPEDEKEPPMLTEHKYLFKRRTTIPVSSISQPSAVATDPKIEARHDTGSDFMSPAVIEDFLKTAQAILQSAEKQPDVQAFLKQQAGNTP